MFLYGYFISMQDVFAASEGADQHDQGGLWQVEIGDHGINQL